MILPNVAKFPNVAVTTFGGLLVDFAADQKADAIIRGCAPSPTSSSSSTWRS